MLPVRKRHVAFANAGKDEKEVSFGRSRTKTFAIRKASFRYGGRDSAPVLYIRTSRAEGGC